MSGMQFMNIEGFISEFGEVSVRVVVENGEPLFCLYDVAKNFNFKEIFENGSKLKDMIDKEFNKEGKFNMYPLIKANGKTQYFSFVNRYELVFVLHRSKLDLIKPFKKWITKEVLIKIKNDTFVNSNGETLTLNGVTW